MNVDSLYSIYLLVESRADALALARESVERAIGVHVEASGTSVYGDEGPKGRAAGVVVGPDDDLYYDRHTSTVDVLVKLDDGTLVYLHSYTWETDWVSGSIMEILASDAAVLVALP